MTMNQLKEPATLEDVDHRIDLLAEVVLQQKKTWLDDLKTWMPLIVVFVSIVAFAVTISNAIDTLKAKDADIIQDMNTFVVRQERINDDRDIQMSDISVRLAEIQKDIVYIRTTLAQHTEND